MTEYVLCYTRYIHDRSELVVIERKKADWQCGKLNMPGGHIEPGETAVEAAVREIWEEGNIVVHPRDVTLLGSMHYPEAMVYVMDCPTVFPFKAETVTAEGELFWTPYWKVLRDPRLIPNLRVIIPLAVAGLSGWKLHGVHGSPDEVVSLDLAGCPCA